MALHIRARPSWPHSQHLPSGSFHKPLILQNENHKHRKVTKLITWIIAWSNSVKLWAMPYKATQDGQVMVESFNKMWSTGEGNGKPLQHSRLENPMNSVKRKKQKIWHWKMKSPGQKVPNTLLEKSKEIASEGMKRLSQVETKPSCGHVRWWK